jgi:hypothetical protein
MSDVDDTLVMWGTNAEDSGNSVEVRDPFGEGIFMLQRNIPMIEMLKTKFHRGCHVVVWSQSGEDWAHAVVQALGLNDYVHMTMAKPSCYGDDLPAEAWMTNRVYLKPDHKWRNNEVSINEPSNAASSTSASTNEGTELRTKASTSIVQSSRD